ncbi:protein phosphatase 2C domain-containing protein [Terrabacter sp. C0L_2]|uniref:protein phosphatase 2C domain-containing protein n=1 Tax=Terrabacter sp. C0L_2 TaxID=3108389 RepID=UPI002ED52436|nr:protein phosphatase 2C domain-containing protein [Terrabacter sp. C0L_2]
MTHIPTTGAPHPAPVPADAASDPGPAAAPASATPTASRDCPVCGTANPAESSFCEACGADLVVAPRAAGSQPPGVAGAPGTPAAPGQVEEAAVLASATPQTAPAGEESPLDVGWTGAVPSAAVAPVDDELTCHACGQGRIVDGYCDHCGTPPPNPRDHLVESPTSWVGGVCDIGRRHARNEDAMSLSAAEAPGSRAVLVVCDGVSMATDSHIASLAAAKAARAVLDQPFPKGAGTPDAWAAGAGRALTGAVARANEAVAAAVVEDVPNPPSCTFVAAVVEDDVIVAGNVGDSRVYWLPDAADEPARQLGRDDSFAQEQMAAGVPRQEAETGPHAHSITRWLGRDAPDDLTPHLTTVTATPGWLMVCSDGLWNYCSEAEALRTLLHEAAGRLEEPTPTAVAQALVDFANEQGGRDNITVALARLAGRGSSTTSEATAPAAPVEGDPTDG